MAEFTTDQLTALATLAETVSGAARECDRRLIVGVFDEEGGLPEAWITATPTDDPVVEFEHPEWLGLLVDEDAADDDDFGK